LSALLENYNDVLVLHSLQARHIIKAVITCKKSSCVTGSFMASLLISRISLGVLPAMRRRMPFIAASLAKSRGVHA
jgi:hypothetical protein